MTEYKPYRNRQEHTYVNKMSAIIARCRLVTKTAQQCIDDLETLTNEHIESNLRQVRKEDE